MKFPLHRLALTGALLSGCFAAQALWQDELATASASQIDQLVSAIAVCPELIPEVQHRLDSAHGHLNQAQTKQILRQAQACQSYRKRLDEPAHTHVAYASLRQVLDSAQALPLPTPSASTLKLSLSLGEADASR